MADHNGPRIVMPDGPQPPPGVLPPGVPANSPQGKLAIALAAIKEIRDELMRINGMFHSLQNATIALVHNLRSDDPVTKEETDLILAALENESADRMAEIINHHVALREKAADADAGDDSGEPTDL